MKSFDVTISDPVGIHAKPAGLLVKEASKYRSTVTVRKGRRTADAGKLMTLLSLGALRGDRLRVEVDGPDEEAAAAAVESIFRNWL